MDDSNYSRNRHNEHLGVNKIGKNIRKSPLHQPNFVNQARPQPQPQVYNINKNDFRNIVQQLTGSPLHHSQEPLPRPPMNSPKPPSMRLQRIRPPPLAPLNVNRPRMPMPVHHPSQAAQMGQMPHHRPPSGPVPFNNNNLARPTMTQPRMPVPPPMSSGDHTGWSNTAESPISAYMRYLQHSIIDSTQGHPHPQYPQNPQSQPPQSAGLLPYGGAPPPLPSPRMYGPPGLLPPRLPSPRMNGPPGLPPPLPSPRMNGPPGLLPPLPSPRMNGLPPPLPSPTSQFLLPSPSGYLNLLSPRSPYPLLSPGYQHPPPLTPNFSFSPMAQPGILGPGPPPPPSPGLNFPLSPGFFPISSPRWRD